jgi:sirohydrochlorin ferrochelatase
MRNELQARLSDKHVALAYMEFAEPTFAQAAQQVHAASARRVLVVPVFLSGGGHVLKDVPPLIEPERSKYPGVTFEMSGAIGEEPEVVEGMRSAVARLVNEGLHRDGV